MYPEGSKPGVVVNCVATYAFETIAVTDEAVKCTLIVGGRHPMSSLPWTGSHQLKEANDPVMDDSEARSHIEKVKADG